MTAPRLDPRIVEDLIVRGEISLIRSSRDRDDQLHLINNAAQWLLARARELREGSTSQDVEVR